MADPYEGITRDELPELERGILNLAKSEEPFMIDPIRLCCGRAWSEHLGSDGNICPDLKVMCCICFNRVTVDQLTTEPDGCKVDVCMSCTVDEATYINVMDIERCKHGTDTSGA